MQPPPVFTCRNLNGRQFYVEGITHDKKTGRTFEWSDWKRTLDYALDLAENSDTRKVSLTGIWDDHAQQWVNLDQPHQG